MQTTIDSTNPAPPRTTAIRQVTVVLPVAQPQTYLQWMRWWRRSERQARTLVANGDLVTRLALAPHPAALFWDMIGHEVSRQAGLAKRQGRTSVMPRIQTTDVVLIRALGYMDRRHRFLECDHASRPSGRPAAPGPEFIELRMRLVESLTKQLAAPSRAQHRRRAAPRSERMQESPRPRARARRDVRVQSQARGHERHRPGQAA
jgi:hypothetical protein